MREKLAERVGLRGEFRATFSRTGARKTQWGTDVTVLLVDVRDERGDLVADHLWFIRGVQMERLALKVGDRLRFMATVCPYTKRNPDAFEDDDRYVVDFRLKHPSNLKLIGREEEVGLPLFDGQPEAI